MAIFIGSLLFPSRPSTSLGGKPASPPAGAADERLESVRLRLWDNPLRARYTLDLTDRNTETGGESAGGYEEDLEVQVDVTLRYDAPTADSRSASLAFGEVRISKDTLGQAPRLKGAEFLIELDATGFVRSTRRLGEGPPLYDYLAQRLLGLSAPSGEVRAGTQWGINPDRLWTAYAPEEKHSPTEHRCQARLLELRPGSDGRQAIIASEWIRRRTTIDQSPLGRRTSSDDFSEHRRLTFDLSRGMPLHVDCTTKRTRIVSDQGHGEPDASRRIESHLVLKLRFTGWAP